MPMRIRPPSIPKIEDKKAVAKVATKMKMKIKSNSIYWSIRKSSIDLRLRRKNKE